jgi:hypothetical protein
MLFHICHNLFHLRPHIHYKLCGYAAGHYASSSSNDNSLLPFQIRPLKQQTLTLIIDHLNALHTPYNLAP